MAEFKAYLVDSNGNLLGTEANPLKVSGSGGAPATHTHEYLPYVVSTSSPENAFVISNVDGTAVWASAITLDNGRIDGHGTYAMNLIFDAGDLES